MSKSPLPKLTELVSPQTLQRLQDNFTEALGIAAVILDLDGDMITKGKEKCFWYDLCCGNINIQKLLRAANRQRPYVSECKNGIFSFAVPILVEGRPIGLIKGGIVRMGNPDLKECKVQAELLKMDFDEYLEHYLELPLFTHERLLAAANLLKMVASTISTTAYAGLSAEEQIQQIIYINDLLEDEVRRKTWDLQRANERYRSLVDNAEDIIYTIDTKGFLTSINPVVKKVIGYEPEEIVGHHFKEFVHPDDYEKMHQSFLDILNGKKIGTSNMEFTLKHKKGGKRWVELNSRGIKDNDDKLFEIEGILRDVTHAHEANEELRSSESQYRMLFDKAAHPIFLLDTEGKVLNVNKAMLDLLGCSQSTDVEGKFFLEFIPKNLQDAYLKGFKEFVKDPDSLTQVGMAVFMTRENTEVSAPLVFSKMSDNLFMGMVNKIDQKEDFVLEELVRFLPQTEHEES